MELFRGDVPPAGVRCSGEEVGYELSPDEGLDAFRNNEVCLGGSEGVREIGQGAHEVCAAPGGHARAEKGRRLPHGVGAYDRDAEEVMGAHEEWIDVQELRSRWLVIGVVETNESIPQEGSELAAGGFELSTCSGSFDDPGQVGLNLQLGMMTGVDVGSPVDLFAGGKDLAGHLELAQFPSKREQVVGGLEIPFRHSIEAVAERKKGVEGDQSLILEGRFASSRQAHRACADHPGSAGRALRADRASRSAGYPPEHLMPPGSA